MMDENHGHNSWNEGILKELSDFSIIFVPTSIIFVAESWWSLKTWIAVQNLAPPQALPKDAKDKWDFRMLGGTAMVFYMTAVMAWGFKRQLSKMPEPHNTDYFYLITLTPPLVYFIGRAISMYLGLVFRVVSRAPSGHTRQRVENAIGYTPVPRSVPYVLAHIPVIASLLFESPVLMAINIAAITRFVISSSTPRFFVGEHMIIASLLCLLSVSLLILTPPNQRHLFDAISYFPEPNSGKTCWPQLILSSYASYYSYNIISACLRFDHANSVSLVSLPVSGYSNSNSGSNVVTVVSANETVEAAVQPPSIKDLRFPKPYFRAALMGWLASFLVMALAVVRNELHVDSMMSGFFATYPSLACMAVFIGVTAIRRKESTKIWSYRENWFIEPEAAVNGGDNTECEEKKS